MFFSRTGSGALPLFRCKGCSSSGVTVGVHVRHNLAFYFFSLGGYSFGSTSNDVVLLPYDKYATSRKKIKRSNSLTTRVWQSSNKELWRPIKYSAKLFKQRSCSWSYSHYGVVILRKHIRNALQVEGVGLSHLCSPCAEGGASYSRPPMVFAVGSNGCSNAATGSMGSGQVRLYSPRFGGTGIANRHGGDYKDIITAYGFTHKYAFTVPAVASLLHIGNTHTGGGSAFGFDPTNQSWYATASLNLTGAHLDRHWFKRWYFEFSWVLFYYLFIKIRYKGKSYKWYRKNSSLVLRFGYSHLVAMRIPSLVLSRKAGKMRLIFFGTNRYDLRKFLSESIVWRPMNVYNGRGLRFARQLVFRKFGKVSAYR